MEKTDIVWFVWNYFSDNIYFVLIPQVKHPLQVPQLIVNDPFNERVDKNIWPWVAPFDSQKNFLPYNT